MTGHAFVKPGQVAPDRPAPDACMQCGQPEASHEAEFATAVANFGTWHVLIHSGTDTASYVIRAEDELTAAAAAGAQHGGPVDGADIEPWEGR